MDKTKLIEDEKQIIMNDLWKQVDRNNCLLDVLLSNKKNSDMYKITVQSRNFIDGCNEKLAGVYNSGKVDFFRKYEYEKILNTYLSKKYKENYMDIELLISPQRKEQEQKVQIDRIEKNKVKKMVIQCLTKDMSKLVWRKDISLTGVTYKTYYEKEYFEFAYHNGEKQRYSTLYNGYRFYFSIDDGEKIAANIDKLSPINISSSHIVTLDQSNMKIRQKSVHKYETNHMQLGKFAKAHKIKAGIAAEMLDKVEKSCRYFSKGQCKKYPRECSALYNDCVLNIYFTQKVEEYVNQHNLEKQKVEKTNVNKKANNKEDNKEYERNVNLGNKIGIKYFVVRTNVFRCMHNKHQIKNIDAQVKIVDANGKSTNVSVSAGYCSQCNTYFLMEPEYRRLKLKGMILCRITDEKTYRKYSYTGEMRLAQQSILMQYGYNVSQTEDLTATQRHKVLAVLIDYDILSKSEIISYLSFFVEQRSKMKTKNMQLAIAKWEEDILFVEMYKQGKYTKYGVGAIRI